MTALDNLKAKTEAVWNSFGQQGIADLQTAVRTGGEHRTEARRALYQRFYNTFNTPDDRPQNPRHTLTFDEINAVLIGLGQRQLAFLGTANRYVDIQNNIFRTVHSAQQSQYPDVFWSLSGGELYRCFYHFGFPPMEPRNNVRLAVNVPLGRIPDAIDNFLINSRTTDGDVISFKVGAPGLYGKPDTALIYVRKPASQQDQTNFDTLVQSVTTWAGQSPANTLRNWTHPLMEKLANGVATADDPPNDQAYGGISFTALRAVIATIVISNRIGLSGNAPQVQGKTAAQAATDELVGQLENYGINANNPARNADLPDQQTRAEIRAYALEVGAAVQ
ncbi:hypothetical protein [Thalassospira profundimaris]|uniref:hypothetical protein n=1 Tax=Thalassospira profundimaris TaxID=502049 RepID=UPI000287361C|nr:hypothetical protein [Thalassospira profundimaris]EKF06278.1 hypothetical protein TH2_20283 [Thalassospira profundimaris WP0211]